MDRRTVNETVAANISRVASASGTNPTTIAHAADIDHSKLSPASADRCELSVAELVRVGGVLRVSPSALLAGVA